MDTPTWQMVLPAVAATTFVVVLTSPVTLAGLMAVAGAVGVVAGGRRGSRTLLTVGVLVQFGAVVVAALGALRFELVLAGSLAVVLSWDLGEQAVTVAEQLGSAGNGTRPLTVHAAGTLLAGTLLFGGVYNLYRVAGSGRPLLALVLLLSGGVLVLAGTRL